MLSALLICFASVTAWASAEVSETERTETRIRLESRLNEIELLIQNQGADQADLERQKKEIEALGVANRIPYYEKVGHAREEIARLASELSVKVTGIRVVSRSRIPPPPPPMVYSDGPAWVPTEDHLVQKIDFEVKARGSDANTRLWIRKWSDASALVRCVKVNSEQELRSAKTGDLLVRATMYRFRDVRFPRIAIKDPGQGLPKWVSRDPELQGKLKRARALLPVARKLARKKERYFLDRARLGFFMTNCNPGV